MELADSKTRRIIKLAEEKGSGAWLTALPIQSLGYTLNKQEFRDAIALRYEGKIAGTPSHCGCGKKNDVDHALSCKLGGYVAMRHNHLRDLEAEILKEVCKDVKTEPQLIPIENDGLASNTGEKSRLDVSAIGIWGPQQRSFWTCFPP